MSLQIEKENTKRKHWASIQILIKIYFNGNVLGSCGIKGGLYWVKTRCLVIIINFKPMKTPENPWKLQYSKKPRRYLGRDGRVFRRYLGRDGKYFGGIWAGTEEFFRVSRPGRNSAKTDVFDLLKKRDNYFSSQSIFYLKNLTWPPRSLLLCAKRTFLE